MKKIIKGLGKEPSTKGTRGDSKQNPKKRGGKGGSTILETSKERKKKRKSCWKKG